MTSLLCLGPLREGLTMTWRALWFCLPTTPLTVSPLSLPATLALWRGRGSFYHFCLRTFSLPVYSAWHILYLAVLHLETFTQILPSHEAFATAIPSNPLWHSWPSLPCFVSFFSHCVTHLLQTYLFTSLLFIHVNSIRLQEELNQDDILWQR